MKKMSIGSPFADEWESELPLFSLDGLLPVAQALSVNTDCLVISLVSTHPVSENPILLQRSLTELQMRLLLPLLESPHYCPHEFLYASLFCSCQGLFAGLFSPKRAAGEEWRAVVSELRAKLRPFGLGISVSTSGSAYALVSLPASEQEAREPWRVPLWAANGSSQPSLSGAI